MAKETGFVICIDAHDLPDIEAWKVYRVLPDAKASEVGCLRLIDESGEAISFLQRGSRPWNRQTKCASGCSPR